MISLRLRGVAKGKSWVGTLWNSQTSRPLRKTSQFVSEYNMMTLDDERNTLSLSQ